MSSYAQRYFSMLRRETAIPHWLGGDPAVVEQPSSDHSMNDERKEPSTMVSQKVDSQEGFEEERPETKEPQSSGNRWTVFAAGAGLFSDGYINNSVGFLTSLFAYMYKPEYVSKSDAIANIAAIAFVGQVVGQLGFGFFVDKFGRKTGMLISCVGLIVFSILCAGSWGVGMKENPLNMFNMLITMRAFVGVFLGSEYPSGSVACAEVCQMLPPGKRNRYFIWFTNSMIDVGFVVAALVLFILLYICSVDSFPYPTHSDGLEATWRLLLGLGAIPPISLFFMRLKFKEPESYTKNKFKKGKTPFLLILKRYGPRLVVVSLIWFIYDFCTYSFGNWSSTILDSVVTDVKTVPYKGSDGKDMSIANIHKTYGWEVLLMAFYLPGTFLGGLVADYIGPRLTLFCGNLLEGIVGFIMAAVYKSMKKNIGGFIVAYGVFTSLGEFGAGDNIGLICSKSCASAVRGRYYGIAAAMGKIGAFVGTKVFPAIAEDFDPVNGIDSDKGQIPLFYISAALCIFSAFLALLIPELSQDAVAKEDIEFRNYLLENGFDPSWMGEDETSEELTVGSDNDNAISKIESN